MKLEEKVFSYIEKYGMIETGSQVVAGFSGGGDSVCLLFLLHELKKRIRFELFAVHVNHGIRGEEAEEDEAFCRDFCKELGIGFSSYRRAAAETAKTEGCSLEEAGRNLRRRAFLEEAEKRRLSKGVRIALAHHENDNAETVLHNLVRGTGLSGLGGIRPVQRGEGDSRYIRPLLSASREEIREYLLEKGLSWREDSTNRETEYTRNKLRLEVLPRLCQINSRAVSHIGETADRLLKIEEYLQKQTDMLYKKRTCLERRGRRIYGTLLEEGELMSSYVIKRVLEEEAGGGRDIGACHIRSVMELFLGKTGARISLPQGLEAWQSYGDVFVGREEKEARKALPELEFQVFPYERQQIPEKTYTKWFDYDKIKQDLEIRRRLAGDYLTINSQGGRKKLKDYFIDCKIPREEREEIPLLAEGSHILWVVGRRISEYYKITSQTKQVLRVQVKGVEENEREDSSASL